MQKFLDLDLPLFMPDATLGSVRALTSDQVRATGTEMLVVNTFHLFTKLGVEGMKKVGGIKKFMDWQGRVLSDSGGFQVYSLIHQKSSLGKITQEGAYFQSPIDGSKHKLTPEISVDMQVAIGSDVIIMLDDCRGEDVSKEEAEKSVDLTTKWAKRGMDHLQKEYPEYLKDHKVFAVVQGGSYKDLREKSSKELQEIGFDGYCFGGWPVDDRGVLISDILETVSESLPDDKPKYAMGVGTPDNIRDCYELGYNMFDCVIPTRNARHGLLYTSHGDIKIKQGKYKYDLSPVDENCSCELCKKYSKAYIHHLFKSGEITALSLATLHNLTYYSDLVKSLS